NFNITGEGGSTPEDPCATPTNVTVEHNVVTWTSDAASFNVSITANGETTTETVTGNSYTVTGFADGDNISVMVQAVCAEDNLSDWTAATEFVFEGTGINNYTLTANVFPNPTTGNVNVVLSNEVANASVQVCDIYGRLLAIEKVEGTQFELNLSGLVPGVYMLRFVEADVILNTIKVVKE
ncbi:MAG: T9SS type A sorting domain-containing protein, partial [Bacteroidales bacterium]|nr:T9SS type A sorting domain-containing protein [Bacteroidales bacterium]